MDCRDDWRVVRDGGCLVAAVIVGLIVGAGATAIRETGESQGRRGADWQVSCDDLDRNRPMGAAMACFRAHAVLGKRVRAAEGARDGDLVVVSFAGMWGVALLPAAQACAVYGDDAAAKAVAVSVVRAVARQIEQYAAHDCVVEVHRNAPGDVDFAVVDFIRQQPIGVGPGGVLAVRRHGAPRYEVTEIEYLAHAGTPDPGKPRWDARKFGPLFAQHPQNSQEVLRLGENGLVVGTPDGRWLVVVLARSTERDGWTLVEHTVCGRSRLEQRFRSSRPELRALLHLKDKEIALRALPGERHEETDFSFIDDVIRPLTTPVPGPVSLEVGAYVMCTE